MLDMGFLPAIRKILDALPSRRQNLLFSATLSDEIQRLARRFMRDPLSIQVSAANTVTAKVLHRVHHVERPDKRRLLEKILAEDEQRQTLVFCRTKHGADRLARTLDRSGFRATAIHGNKSQGARTTALASFKSQEVTVLVATDIAARGLDIRQLPIVVNYDLPLVAGDYIHRIGRTGRAGRDGQAVSLVSDAEKGLLHDIQKLLGERIEVVRLPAADPARRVVPANEDSPPRRDRADQRNGSGKGERAPARNPDARPGRHPVKSSGARKTSRGRPAGQKGNRTDRRPRVRSAGS
jgi:ATP-dependent RNA helicase RhlE